jgi:hypothetical protein
MRLGFRPVPVDERVPMTLTTQDLTGTGADSLFNRCLESALDSDYLFSMKRTNEWNPKWSLVICQNPFCHSSPSDSRAVRLDGQIEIADYYTSQAAALDVLAGYIVFGLFGAAAVARDEEDTRVGSFQCRFQWQSEEAKGPLVVCVARATDVRNVSRQQTMNMAARDAASVLLFELAHELAARGIISLRESTYITGTEDGARALLPKLTGMTIE